MGNKTLPNNAYDEKDIPISYTDGFRMIRSLVMWYV